MLEVYSQIMDVFVKNFHDEIVTPIEVLPPLNMSL